MDTQNLRNSLIDDLERILKDDMTGQGACSRISEDIEDSVQGALAEDIGSGDVSAQLISEEKQVQAQVICREQAILCGTAWFNQVFKQLDNRVDITWYTYDSQALAPLQQICILKGTARSLLTGERTALNFLQLLSGTATQVKRYAELIKHTKAKILDTRKTIPNLRSAQKYAVRCGGGYNHRMGLYDAFLIKENHIFAVGSITQVVNFARELAPDLPLEIEVETLEQIEEALNANVERLLLDNFTLSMLREAVEFVDGVAELEASGNVNLRTVKDIAETGVDYISIGELTKNVTAVDFSMRILS